MFDSSSNSSSLTLNETESGPSNAATQNILPATEKHRSWPHLMSSVTAGNSRQSSRKVSRFISPSLGCPLGKVITERHQHQRLTDRYELVDIIQHVLNVIHRHQQKDRRQG